jgi:hypothetical protein
MDEAEFEPHVSWSTRRSSGNCSDSIGSARFARGRVDSTAARPCRIPGSSLRGGLREIKDSAPAEVV